MWPVTGVCYFAVKSYDRKSRGSILLQEKSGGGWDGSMDRGWEISRRTEKQFFLMNGEAPQGHCTWWCTGNWMALRQPRWERARLRNFHQTEQLQRRRSCPDHHNWRCTPSVREKAGVCRWATL